VFICLKSHPASTESGVGALNPDVVGYSALMADDFDMTATAMSEIRRVVEEHVTGSGGTLVNFVGDNFMAVFADPKDAMQSAISITRAVEDFNGDNAKTRQVHFRMGFDNGTVTVSGDQFRPRNRSGSGESAGPVRATASDRPDTCFLPGPKRLQVLDDVAGVCRHGHNGLGPERVLEEQTTEVEPGYVINHAAVLDRLAVVAEDWKVDPIEPRLISGAPDDVLDVEYPTIFQLGSATHDASDPGDPHCLRCF
jgi:hypothetical protein